MVRIELAADIEAVRVEIKTWEKAFRDSHNGSNPSRQDIKNHAGIAARYKHYDVLRGRQATRQCLQSPSKIVKHRATKNDREALRERNTNITHSTPKKEPAKIDFSQPHRLSPVKEEEPTPAHIRHLLGPTPQKDGQILGLFDLPASATPSKRAVSTPSKFGTTQLAATPSKPSSCSPVPINLCRTPQSSSKRFHLDAFLGTPLKRKREEDHGTPPTVKRLLATPSFLQRRDFSLAPVEEEDRSAFPPLRRKRGMVRSLSSMIQEQRQNQRQELDDEQDIMDEIEAEARGQTLPPKPMAIKQPSFVADSQDVEMPLGPDQGPPDSDEETYDPGALDANGNPRKVWKKKGLKRQTRRSKMKPVLHMARKEADVLAEGGEGGESEEEERKAVQVKKKELRPREDRRLLYGDNDGDDSGEDGSDFAEEEHHEEPALVSKIDAAKGKGKDKKVDDKAGKQDGPIRKAVKKVSAQAHQNFRRLKIKQKQPKSSGRGGRFGKR